MREIGSEFWLEHKLIDSRKQDIPSWLKLGYDSQLLLSGRTAIHFVLIDILKNKKINSVYFPSYCCQSMLQPFIDLGINIKFYDVYYDNGLKFNINQNQQCDIFFAMNYFGFSKGRMDKYINQFKQRGITVIEDITHSLLSKDQYNVNSDYMIASLRKWFPILSGGIAFKNNGSFYVLKKEETLNEMIQIRKLAMINKKNYIKEDEPIEKQDFLNKYSVANKMLNKNYKLLNIDKYSIQILNSLNIKSIINKRRKNSEILFERLSKKKEIKLLFNEMNKFDCPVFFPIVFNSKKKRDFTHKYLINNNIYCPIHWPIPNYLERYKKTNIYDIVLSLIIDQRYSEEDMNYIIKKVE